MEKERKTCKGLSKKGERKITKTRNATLDFNGGQNLEGCWICGKSVKREEEREANEKTRAEADVTAVFA